MKHNFFEVGDRVMRVKPFLIGLDIRMIPIEIGSVNLVIEVADKLQSFTMDVAVLSPEFWGGQYVRLDHPFFSNSEGRPCGWIHSNSLQILSSKDLIETVVEEIDRIRTGDSE